MAKLKNGYLKMANEIYDAFSKTRIRAEYRQMLDFIIRKTYGFNKKEDDISTSQFIEGTGLKRHAVHKARKWLKDHGFITVTQKGDSFFLTYSFQKDCKKWKVSPKKVTVTQKGIRVSPKKVAGVSPKKVSRTITKDNLTKDTIQKTVVAKTPQAKFMESFSSLYERMTGHSFSIKKEHYAMIAKIINKHGYDAVVEKAKILAVYCQEGEIWFCKNGWSDFTPEKLSKMWNSILPIKSEDQKKAEKSKSVREEIAEHERSVRELLENPTK